MKKFFEKYITPILRLTMVLFVFIVTSCESHRTIVNGLDERSANEIIILLAKEDIQAYKIEQEASGAGGGPKVVLWDIAVAPSDVENAMQILIENGLPRVSNPNLLQLFSETGLVPSERGEQIRYQVGLANTLANIIRKIDGVVDADVAISWPKENPLNPNAPTLPITAAVYIKHTGVLDNPNLHLISKIKLLVAGAVPGLSYENVTVIPSLARFSFPLETSLSTAPREDISVLGFTMAKTSAHTFMIFFIFCMVVSSILCFMVIWLAWKLYPLLKNRGGILQIFHMTPLPDETFIQSSLIQDTSIQDSSPIGKETPKPEEKEQSDK